MSDIQRARDNALQQQYKAAVQNFYETHNHQIDGQDAKEYLLELFRENFPALRAEAMEAATACAEDLAVEIVVQIAQTDPALLSNLRKPRLQAAFVSAQKSYAETGDPDTKSGNVSLGRVLAKLVSQLAAEEADGFGEIVLRQAIEIAPKLTRRQMNFLSVTVLFSSLQWPPLSSVQEVAAMLHNAFSPYYQQIPANYLEYSYMTASGVGALLFGKSPYQEILDKNVGATRKWFTTNDLPPETSPESLAAIIEADPDSNGRWRLHEDVGALLNETLKGLTFKTKQDVRKFVAAQYLSIDELKAAFADEIPDLAEFLGHLESTKALGFIPNAVGYLLAKEELSLRFPGTPFVESLAADLKKNFASE